MIPPTVSNSTKASTTKRWCKAKSTIRKITPVYVNRCAEAVNPIFLIVRLSFNSYLSAGRLQPSLLRRHWRNIQVKSSGICYVRCDHQSKKGESFLTPPFLYGLGY